MVWQARSLSQKRLSFSINSTCSTPIWPKKLYSANKGALAGQGMASRWRTEALNKHEDPITYLPQKNMGFLSVIPTDYSVELMNSSWKQLSNPWVTQQRLRSPPRFCSSQTAQTDSSQRTGQAGSFCLHTCNMYTKEKGRTWLNITRTRPKITSTSWTYSNSTRNSGLGCVKLSSCETLSLRDIFACIIASCQSPKQNSTWHAHADKLLIAPDSSTML